MNKKLTYLESSRHFKNGTHMDINIYLCISIPCTITLNLFEEFCISIY